MPICFVQICQFSSLLIFAVYCVDRDLLYSVETTTVELLVVHVILLRLYNLLLLLLHYF